MFNSVMRAFAWLVGIAALLIAAGALPSSHPLPILMCLMMVVPATAIHEAGHAFAARWNGMRVIEIHVWLLNILPLSRGLRWRFASPPNGVGGLGQRHPRSVTPTEACHALAHDGWTSCQSRGGPGVPACRAVGKLALV